MEATLDLGQGTLSSDKHAFNQFPLQQAANGHLLLPLTPAVDQRFQVAAETDKEEGACLAQTDHAEVFSEPADGPAEDAAGQARPVPERQTPSDLKRHFQTILKHTRYTQVDVGTYRYHLRMLFGQDVDAALCAYRPRYERIPKQSATQQTWRAVAEIDSNGKVSMSPWSARMASARRAEHISDRPCIFAFRWQQPPEEVSSQACKSDLRAGSMIAQQATVCSSSVVAGIQQPSVVQSPQPHAKASAVEVEACAPTSSDCDALTCNPNTQDSRAHETYPNKPESVCLSGAGIAACDCCASGAEPDSRASDGFQASLGVDKGLEAMYEEVDWVTLEHQSMPTKSRRSVASQVEAVRRVPFQLALASLREQPEETEKELSQWLGEQAPVLQKEVGLIEVFTSSKARLALASERARGMSSIRLGLHYGQDFSRAKDRRLLLVLIARCRSKDVWFSWPCSPWCAWSRMNIAKGGSAAEKVLTMRGRQRVFLRLVEQAWALQQMLGGHAHAENPMTSEAWQELVLGPVFEADFHMCAVGLRCPKTKGPVLKPTRILTSDSKLAAELSQYRCPGHKGHQHLEGSWRGISLTKWAEVYPSKLCRRIALSWASRDDYVDPSVDIFLNTEDEADSERESEADEPAAGAEEGDPQPGGRSYTALVQKLHVNTGHASVPQMLRLAQRAKAPEALVSAIRKFTCPVCDELQVPPSHRVAALRHTEVPNQIVGVDVVQVELKKDTSQGLEETKYDVLTVVDYASDFCQQVVLGSQAFHAVWCRPYGPPQTVYVDPDQRWMSNDFQQYLRHNSMTLLESAAESHWQLGRVEIAQKILRGMAQRVWRTASRPAPEIIEQCASVRNEQLKRHGYSSAQWFLGREPRVPGSLADCVERDNPAVQDAVASERDFSQKMHVRQLAAHAFIEAHARSVWSQAIKGRPRPLRGPYVVGQKVYVFRRRGRGLLSTRHGVWLGPGRVVGTESFREDSPIPRVIWVVINGYMYKCSPECLRPVTEDEVAFREIASQFHAGALPEELERANPARRGPAGRFFDLTQEPPGDEDFESEGQQQESAQASGSPRRPMPARLSEEGPENAVAAAENPERDVRRRITHSENYWQQRATDFSPRNPARVRHLEEEGDDPISPKSRRILDDSMESANHSLPVVHDCPASPSRESGDQAGTDVEVMPPEPTSGVSMSYEPDSHVPEQEGVGHQALNQEGAEDVSFGEEAMCCEVALDVFGVDVTSDDMCLWEVLDQCMVAASRPAQKRRVEVSFRRLSDSDKQLFRTAMKKEWQSWLENKVTTIVKGRGIDRSRVIGSRWVLTWKKSSDPDDRSLTPKARLVLVGYQDPDLGKIATESPTVRKESKHLILSICASKRWVIWGADIKTAFLSGDASNRGLHFKPPPEVRDLMKLGSEDVLRLEEAAYGLAEAPRAWFLRLSRELAEVGLQVSLLDPCVFMLRHERTSELLGICGIHVDDLLGGGTAAMDECLSKLRKRLPFGDFRTQTIKYTGAEIRQNQDGSIELSQEAYIDKMEEVSTKPFGPVSARIPDPTLMRACSGQLAWVANHSRPDQAFLASFLQGVQDQARVQHLALYNKAVREMKQQKVCLRFPVLPIERWRLLVVTDAGWGVRESGESQGGLLVCLCDKDVLDQRRGVTWIIEWSSKKLRRVVRSSTAAETLAAQNGLDAIEFAQGFLQEVLYGMTPREFRQWTPQDQSGLVIDSKSLYDALTRSACSSSLAMEKRLAIDYAIARACLSERNVVPFWTNNLQMVSDCLTKLRGSKDILLALMKTCSYHIRPSTESGRKEAAKQHDSR